MATEDYGQGSWDLRTRAILDFAVQLTRDPASMTEKEIEKLRERDLSDREILDLVQVVGYFNYINRVAEALGVGKGE